MGGGYWISSIFHLLVSHSLTFTPSPGLVSEPPHSTWTFFYVANKFLSPFYQCLIQH